MVKDTVVCKNSECDDENERRRPNCYNNDKEEEMVESQTELMFYSVRQNGKIMKTIWAASNPESAPTPQLPHYSYT